MSGARAEIGLGVINELVGLLWVEPIRALVRVGGLQRQGLQLCGGSAVRQVLAQSLARLNQRGVATGEVADSRVVQVIEIGGGVGLSRAGADDTGDKKWTAYNG